jgi:hypothetical protein
VQLLNRTAGKIARGEIAGGIRAYILRGNPRHWNCSVKPTGQRSRRPQWGNTHEEIFHKIRRAQVQDVETGKLI